jgi:hypothetical protein
MDAEDWLLDTERKLKTVDCNDGEKIRYATHLLCGPAAAWWDNVIAIHPPGRVFTWEEFKKKFREANVPESIMELKRREFDNLEQKDKSIMKYVKEFTLLSRYAFEEVNTDEKRKKRFMRGLHPMAKMQLRMLKASDFQELVDAAITLEDDLKQVEEERRKKARLEPHKFPTSKPTTDLRFKPRFQTRGDNPNQERSNYGDGKVCGNCGLRGHLTSECRKPKIICFECNKEGHMQKNCPNKARGAGRNGGGSHKGGGSGDGSNRRSNRLYGKLNYLEEQNNSNKAVIGTLQIFSYPRQVLSIPMPTSFIA